MDAASLQFNPADPAAWRERLLSGAVPEPEALAATAREFEAMLLRQYLAQALKPATSEGALFGANSSIYQHLITDALASSLSAGGVFGFSNLLQAQLAGAPANEELSRDHDAS